MKRKTFIQLSVFMLIFIGSFITVQAQDKKTMIIEVTTFNVNSDVDQQVFSQRDAEIDKDYTSKQPGYIKRLSGMNEQGEWVVIVYWKTMEDAKASMNKFMTDKSVADYAAMIDGPTMKMNRYSSVMQPNSCDKCKKKNKKKDKNN